VVNGVNVWRAGQRALLAETRRLLPGAPIMVNGDLRIDGLARGREMEGFPLIPGAALAAGIDSYLYDAQAGQGHTIVNPDNVTRLTPSSESAEATVGVSLLGDGYAAYDRGWIAHGDPWWFDEYDGGAGSALTQQVDAAATVVPVARPWRFHAGDVVLVDQEAMRVRRVLTESLLAQRGVMGTTPVWHIARTVVTTERQRAQGHGYLGRALGAARLVQTGDWSRYALPLTLLRGVVAATSNGHLQRLAGRPISRATVIQVNGGLHYRADAVGLTLLAPPDRQAMRTLVFTPTAVPLVLRSSWHRYAIPVGGTGRFLLGLGRVGGRVEVKGLQLLGTQAFVLRRDFAHGVVLVNPTDKTQHIRLERPYRVLSGDGNPWANNGRVVRSIAIARYRAAILLR
ncbi:MAG: hypothetical protein LC769_13585, partial [Chloroflexi bacterium]|nr:hypothetical protein [Chloroflexota bacterium]